MSGYERNKGKLIPIGIDTENFTEADYDNLYDNGMTTVNGEVYKIEWEINQGEPLLDFADVKVNEDGTIDFHTCHYNGGGHWTEVVEYALEGK